MAAIAGEGRVKAKERHFGGTFFRPATELRLKRHPWKVGEAKGSKRMQVERCEMGVEVELEG